MCVYVLDKTNTLAFEVNKYKAAEVDVVPVILIWTKAGGLYVENIFCTALFDLLCIINTWIVAC